MTVFIERDAFQTILYGALSCRCPLTPETEAALFEEYFRWGGAAPRPFDPIRAIVDRNPARTPIHNLFEVASYRYDDPREITISLGDALRALGSKFHFNNVVRGLDPLRVRDLPAFLVSHMLVPARPSGPEGGQGVVFAWGGRQIVFDPVFFAPGLRPEPDGFFGVHMGTAVCTLTAARAEGLERHLDLIPGFSMLCGQVARVDFTDFQYDGDYHGRVRQRFRRHFG